MRFGTGHRCVCTVQRVKMRCHFPRSIQSSFHSVPLHTIPCLPSPSSTLNPPLDASPSPLSLPALPIPLQPPPPFLLLPSLLPPLVPETLPPPPTPHHRPNKHTHHPQHKHRTHRPERLILYPHFLHLGRHLPRSWQVGLRGHRADAWPLRVDVAYGGGSGEG